MTQTKKTVVGVVAVQGAFAEHSHVMHELGCEVVEIRQPSHLQEFDALILPGGESTAQRKLLHDLGLFEPLRQQIEGGTPVLATCAGMILLAQEVREGQGSGVPARHAQFVSEYPTFATMPVTVERNAYGRQLGSFKTVTDFAGLGKVEATFIRAPYAAQVGEGVKVLANVEGKDVAVRYRNMVALAFHPELDGDVIHRWFLDEVVAH
ncbi:MAG: pyridoxal 5'-phosphate synthase glutaminase subunit PdxT [Actinomycetaceae bacterium]|nr:pyridoxal 5'-phosphate synthase glutaminase subunit PdxT [Actinomycetaceae bacterium]